MELKYEDGDIEELKLKGQFLNIMKINKIDVISYIDSDATSRISRGILKNNRVIVYYHRYKLFVLYKYNSSLEEDNLSLIDIMIFRLNECNEFYEIKDYLLFFKTLLFNYLPNYFKYYNESYRVVYIYSEYPFTSESSNIINQEYFITDNYDIPPPHPRILYFVLEVKKTQFVCKFLRASKASLKSHFFDNYNFPRTVSISCNDILLAIPVNKFLDDRATWEPLNNYLKHDNLFTISFENYQKTDKTFICDSPFENNIS